MRLVLASTSSAGSVLAISWNTRSISSFLNKLGGGCQVPIGAAAEMRNGRLHLDAIVANPDGSKVLRESRDGDDPEKLGSEVGETLLRRGGDVILEEVYGRGLAVPQQP